MARAWRLHWLARMRLPWLVICAGCAQPVPPHPDTRAPTCATDLDSELGSLHVPGLAAGLVAHGQLACTAAAGMADIAAARPVTEDTLFALASTSKLVTATAVLKLFDDGKLGLDDDVNVYLPYRVAIPSCTDKPVTFRQLLTHTGSIADNAKWINCPGDCAYGTEPIPFVTRGADSPIAMADFTRAYLTPGAMYYSASANFEAGCPGTIDDYSNMGVVLLAAVAETIAGERFEQLTRDRIFAPLGMTESSWLLATIDPARLATPYDWTAAKGFFPYGQLGEPDWPDGGLRSSVVEMAKFLGAFSDRTLLAPSTIDEAMRPQIPALDDTQGLVWFYQDFGAHHVIGHDGSDNGVSTYMFVDPKTGAGVILLSNGVWTNAADALMAKLFDEAATY